MTFYKCILLVKRVFITSKLKGLEKAKTNGSGRKRMRRVLLLQKISTQDTDVVNTSISKTILADARTALKMTSRTGKIETVLSGE